MSVRLTMLRGLWGMGVAAAVMAVWTLHAAEGSPKAGRPIEFSDPASGTRVTNLNHLDAETYGTRNREVDSSANESLASPGSSLIGIMPAPVPSSGIVVNRRRGKDLFDTGNNSMFQTPEDALRERLIKDLLKLPEYEIPGQKSGVMQQPASSREQFYGRLFGGGRERDNPSKYSDPFGSRGMADDDSGLAETEESKSLLGSFDATSPRNLLGFDADSRRSMAGARPNSLLDLLGFRNNRGSDNELVPETKREEENLKRQLDEFRAILGYPSSTLDAPGLVPGPAPPNPWLSSSPASSTAADRLNPFAQLPGTAINPALVPPTPPPAPMPSSLSPVLDPSLAGRTPAPKPIFSVPQRAF